MNRAETQEKNEKKALVSEELLFSGRIFDLRRKSLIFPDDSKKVFEWIDHPGAVVILPITNEGKMLLIKQWRRAPGEILYEFPAGTLEENETPDHCALRELQEETGYKGSVKFLSKFYSSPGFTNELLFLYLAKDLVESPLLADDTESIDLVELTLEQTLQMVDEGVIQDAKTICALYFYLRASYA